MPVPTNTQANSPMPFPAPNSLSPRAATSTSLPSAMGTWKRACNGSRSGTRPSPPPRLGAARSTPAAGSTCPATPSPMPLTCLARSPGASASTLLMFSATAATTASAPTGGLGILTRLTMRPDSQSISPPRILVPPTSTPTV